MITAPSAAILIRRAGAEVKGMRIFHPLWRGFWLAALIAASLVLMGFTDSLAAFRLGRKALAFSGAVTVGAFLAALPKRLRKGAASMQSSSWQRCLRAFLCGAGMALALGFAGAGWILPALMTGSAGGCVFAVVALIAGVITVRLHQRRRA